ncbi:hypothetical protein [Klebsiella pneumoniae]|uniref:hypothetical protein n=1 Tax=Klebsiella pneumoniae TaxID=573 RepID=UPI003626EF3F
MNDNKINYLIADLMQEVQNAALDSEKEITDSDYIEDVNRRIGEIEKSIVALKHELTKHNLNDW